MAPEDQASTPVVAFQNVTKRYGDVVAASEIDLEVGAGEFLSLLGPSGCGKTTSLRMIAGFEQPTEGDVLIEGERVNGVPAYRRHVNMVFQHYALFPHLTVADNVAYGLKQRSPRPPREEIGRRVRATLEQVRLTGFERRRIWEMSGGQQQRVALARALINEPKVLLLDEPLAALDRKLRRDMQIELQNLQRSLGITFILVTHDQEEALSMSDRVCIMRDGRIVQVGSPRELYDQPASRYVADFVGKSNFFDGTVGAASASGAEIRLDCGITVPAGNPNGSLDLGRRQGQRVGAPGTDDPGAQRGAAAGRQRGAHASARAQPDFSRRTYRIPAAQRPARRVPGAVAAPERSRRTAVRCRRNRTCGLEPAGRPALEQHMTRANLNHQKRSHEGE